jgi:hypothetical protein
MLALSGYYTIHSSQAQLIPVPPPAPDSTDQLQNKGSSNDSIPPEVHFLTTELYPGKNVFKVNITDDSGIRMREVRYVHEGIIESQDLVFDGNHVYKGLVNVNPPSAVIVVNVNDIYGNKASYSKSLPVKQFPDIFTEMFNRLTNR